MEEALPVHVGKCLQGLKSDIAYFCMWELSFLLLELIDVAV